MIGFTFLLALAAAPHQAGPDRGAIVREIAAILQEGTFSDATGTGARYQVTAVGPCILKFDKVYAALTPGGYRPDPAVTLDFSRKVAVTPLSSATLWVRYEGQGAGDGYQLSPWSRSKVGRLEQLLAGLQASCVR